MHPLNILVTLRNAKPDLNIRCAVVFEGMFSDVTAHIGSTKLDFNFYMRSVMNAFNPCPAE